jgi:hypothetical protein
MHQSLALEEMGHEVHYYHPDKHPLGMTDYLHSFDFDLIFLDMEFLRSLPTVRILTQFRNAEPVRVVGALYQLPGPAGHAWELVDFTVTPWKGETVEALSEKYDIRYLPLGYNDRLHRRISSSINDPIFVGNTTGDKQKEADACLLEPAGKRRVRCIGPAFAEKYVDPFLLGDVYAAARCLPNFHYSWEKSKDCILNERFWQTARCGIPVNDYSPLMEEVFEKSLLERFCFADKRQWQDRIRAWSSASEKAPLEIVQKLDQAMQGHSYRDRMRQLIDWIS